MENGIQESDLRALPSSGQERQGQDPQRILRQLWLQQEIRHPSLERSLAHEQECVSQEARLPVSRQDGGSGCGYLVSVWTSMLRAAQGSPAFMAASRQEAIRYHTPDRTATDVHQRSTTRESLAAQEEMAQKTALLDHQARETI